MKFARLQNPVVALRVTTGLILLGGAMAGLGTLLRGLIDGRNDQWTFLFDTCGLIVASVGAVLDFRASARLGDIELPHGRRRAVLQLTLGLLAALGGCYVLGWVLDDGKPLILSTLLSALMTAGIGALLAGMLYIGWFGGGDHLERRIQQRADEEW